ncbi:DNA mismatch repair [Parasponia andersonii]|uniref:DNA mismatch repair n=1 Tax=Parasponia andersonii TaxID=3476 RepID=A0A2P5DJ45_PARAD|nr:DNA mismatch repair [Parasponia andersonii]
MQRQRSILSFFQKPSPENQSSGGQPAIQVPATDSAAEIRGTDTPPEKVPRQILPASHVAGEGKSGSFLFSSIKHKFTKPSEREKASERNNSHGSAMDICMVSEKSNEPRQLSKPGVATQRSSENDIMQSKGKVDQNCIVHVESDDDIPGPETPGAQRFVPRLKRIQDDGPQSEDKCDRSLLGPGKKLKLLEESTPLNRNQWEISDTASKFEWLNPSRIKDANGRKCDDPLYDKTTLYIPADALKKMSASQRQYWNAKCQYVDVVLFFKVGKFYELYEIDAEIGHKELDWKITLSGVGKCRQVGVSESGIDDAVQKLVARGYKVGRVEQLETAGEAKARGANSVISRKLVQVVSPSTATDGNLGPDAVHLLAIKVGNLDLENGSTVYGFAFVDCAALKFWVGSIKDDSSCAGLGALLMQVSPKEVLYESRGLSKEGQRALRKYSSTGSSAPQLTPMQPITDFADASEVRNLIQLKGYFKRSSNLWNHVLDNVMHHDITLSALGGLISHLSRLMLDDVLQNGDVLPYQVYRGCLKMDGQTLVNLEIFSNNADGGTLYKYLDNCVTSSGKRLLRRWICHPLKDIGGINNRLNVVEALVDGSEIMLLVAQYLRKLPDLERLLGRIRASAESSATLLVPVFGKKVLKQKVKVFGMLVKGLRVGFDLLLLLEKERHAFALLSKNFKLPLLRGSDGLDQFLTQFEAAIDSDFPNYQNHDVTDRDAETISILIELFIEKVTEWSQIIHAINCIDVLRSFAVTASCSSGTMSRPVVLPPTENVASNKETRHPVLKIKGLWHPFAFGDNGRVPVPNDVVLGEDANAVILAQLGCYVPCERCVLSLVDIVFTRLGATDRIMTGESTFFIECTETASVLRNSTQDSLVILDELGRGTSTFDGYAIAYAVFRHLIENVNCRLLFATHYHPLTKEFASHPHVTLQHMACSFKSKSESFSQNEELVFLYRLTSGACPESYGLQVATMAGIPKKVVNAASKAGQVMKKSIIGDSFKCSEGRAEFSTLHEEWLKSLMTVSLTEDSRFHDEDDDVFDTLLCLWHELKSSYRLGN